MKKLLLLLIIPLLSFGQPPIPPDSLVNIQNYNGPVDFAVVESAPVFPGCENLVIDGEIKEISHKIDILKSVYEEVKSLNYFLFLDKNKKIIQKIKTKEISQLNKKEIKFIEKTKDEYINRIITQLIKAPLINSKITSHIQEKLINNDMIIWDEKSHLIDYIYSKIKEFESDLNTAKIYVKKNEIVLKRQAGKNCLNRGILNHVKKNFKYPPIAKEAGIQGKVFVSFVIDKTGNVKEVKVLRGVDGHLDKEAVRLIKSLPKMQPAVQRGTPVSITYTIPIHFLLQ